jgi:sugar lactone lactonase YvrE
MRQRIWIAIPILLLTMLVSALAVTWWITVPTPHLNEQASIKLFGAGGPDSRQLHEPTGIALAADLVFVADARGARIQVFSSNGEFRRTFGADFLDRPMNIAARAGRLYVADYFRDSIEVFDFNGIHLDTIVVTDDEDAGLNNPGGVDVFDDGSVLVADTYNHRVVRLSADGLVVRSWGERGRAGRARGEFRYPSDVEIAPDGGFFVADAYNHRIQRFDAEGRLTDAWGGLFALGLPGSFNGWFNVVSSIDLGADGDSILAVDFFNQRIQCFSLDGELLAIYKVAEAGPERSIMGVASASPTIAWVTNLTRNRIERWRLRCR